MYSIGKKSSTVETESQSGSERWFSVRERKPGEKERSMGWVVGEMWWLPSADAGPVSRAAPPTTEVTESSTNQFSHIYNTVQYIQTQPARSQLWSYQPHKPVLSYIQYNTLQNIQTVMVLSTTQSSSIIYTTQ